MNQNKQNINELSIKINNLTSLVDYKLTDVGKLIALIKDLTVESAQFHTVFNEILEIKKRIPEAAKTINRIDKAIATLDEINRELIEKKRAIRDKEKESASVFEKIGQVSYTVFKSKKINFNGFGEMFDELRKLDEKADGYRSHDGSDIDSNKPVLSQIVTIAKAIFSSQAYQINLTKYSRAYRAVGALVAQSDYNKEAGESQLDYLIESLRKVQKELGDLTVEQDGLLSKKTKISETLESLGVETNSRSRIRELTIEQKKLESTLHEHYHRLGTIYLDNPKVISKSNPDVEKLYTELRHLSKEKDKYTSDMKKCEASIEIDVIREKMKKITKKIEHLTLVIRKSEVDIKTHKNQLTQFENEKEKLEKIVDDK